MNAADTYSTIIEKMDKLPVIEKNLNRVGMLQEVLRWLGSPEKKLRVIHIVGTNGKGSTGAMLANILVENGYHVGHFSTPAIVDQREVISIDNQIMSEDDFRQVYLDILTEIEAHGGYEDTLNRFEWLTLMAIVYFERYELDFVILEASFGGKKDPTNAIESPFMVIITKISSDHLGRLGQTLTEIAQEKAASIKPAAIVVNYPGQDLEVEAVLKARCEAVGAIWSNKPHPVITVLQSRPKGLFLNINDIRELYLSLTGNYQANNLSTVISAMRMLEDRGFATTPDKSALGLAHVQVKGRMEYDQERNILFDGAHNPEGFRGLISSIRSWHLPFKPVFVLGLMEDSRNQEILEEILPQAGNVITVTPDSPLGMSADKLAAEIVLNSTVDVEIADDASAAIQLARRSRESSQALIVVTGSFYTLRAILKEDEV
ncbi:MAG: tetrahydrofolate synthase [Lactobacillaceae bacterium]|jgi:dihydrofolate synthase/folylpolyglutamate synthase|nr:tetrahydrofolate synthase [Lactobacillaceae bacterium]